MIFEGLDKIQWSSLKQAHGTAEHIPSAIRGLVSQSDTERKSAYWKLGNHVVLQSDLYESAFYVIPFLIDILKSSITYGRNYAYSLLYEIANGDAPDDMVVFYEGNQMPLKECCHYEIGKYISIYLSDVESENSESRNDALELLALYSEHKASIIPRLQRVLKREKTEFSSNIIDVISELNE